MSQSYERHAHHPIPTYVAALLWLAAMLCLVGWSWFGWQTFTMGVFLLALSIVPLIGISRRYIIALQDRIILLEMKVRCAEVVPDAAAQLAALTPKQIVALRFASDEELGPLLERAVRDRLSPKDIKKAVKEWRPDYLRT